MIRRLGLDTVFALIHVIHFREIVSVFGDRLGITLRLVAFLKMGLFPELTHLVLCQ